MADYRTDEGICLRVTDFSETSQIAVLLTAREGLLPVIAKGAKRRTKSTGNPGAFSGPLDLLTSGQIVFIPAKGAAELGTLSAWQLTDHRTALRQDLRALQAAMVATEITLTLLHPHDPHEDLYAEFIAAVDLFPTPQRQRALVAYAKAALSAAGYLPQLDACLICGKPFPADASVRFAPRAGGAICDACPANLGPTIPVPARLLVALDRLSLPRILQSAPPERPADPTALRLALQLLLDQIQAIADRAVRTRWLLDSIFT